MTNNNKRLCSSRGSLRVFDTNRTDIYTLLFFIIFIFLSQAEKRARTEALVKARDEVRGMDDYDDCDSSYGFCVTK